MKRTILILCVLVICTIADAQHMTFLGIPIDDSAEVFDSKITSKGFRRIHDYDTYCAYSGKYGSEEVAILVHIAPKSNKVYAVEISFNEAEKGVCRTQQSKYINIIGKKYKTNLRLDADNNYQGLVYKNGNIIGMILMSIESTTALKGRYQIYLIDKINYYEAQYR